VTDIIIFALLALFFAIRLFRVLGQRVEVDPLNPQPMATKVSHGKVEEVWDDSVFENTQVEWTPKALSQMDTLLKMDPSFKGDHFQEGAMLAFKEITQAYAQGDMNKLATLLDPSVFESFSRALKKRYKKGEVLESSLLNIRQMRIQDLSFRERNVNIEVYFMSEQTIVIRDKAGEVLSGTPNLIEEIEEIWTFSRQVDEEDPNWLLSKTESLS
jgi:predicted lipid-binding transport protein (Tim44 family)